MDRYNSTHKGSQIDSAVSVVLQSGVTSTELSKLHEVAAGTAKASKAVILDNNKNISGLGSVSANNVSVNYVVFSNLEEDPSAVEGKRIFYFKSGKIYIRSESGISEFKSGKEIITDVTAQTQVIVNHTHGTKYPIVSAVDSNGNEVEVAPVYNTETRFTIQFNNAFTGKIISRSV